MDYHLKDMVQSLKVITDRSEVEEVSLDHQWRYLLSESIMNLKFILKSHQGLLKLEELALVILSLVADF